MSKIVVFNGSPHNNGTTAAILAEVAKGAADNGAEVVVYDLNAPGIRGCQACNLCRKEGATACAQYDYLRPMYQDILEADGIVLGTPIWAGNITGQTLVFLNRLMPFASRNLAAKAPGKNFVVVITQDNPDGTLYTSVVEMLESTLARRGWHSVGRLIWADSGHELPGALAAEAFASGQRLVKQQ